MSEVINSKKNFMICMAGLVGTVALSAGVVAVTANNDSAANVLNDNKVTQYGGFSLLINSSVNNDDYVMGAGIESCLKSYSGLSDIETGATIDSKERVLSLLPEDEEEKAKEAQAAAEAEAAKKAAEEASKPVQSVISGYTVLGVANVENYLNVRETPDEGGTLLGKLPMNAGCEIEETLDGWYKIKSGDVEGYVSAEYLLTGNEANQRATEALTKVARVNADKLMVREQMSTESSILTRVAEGEELEVVGQSDGWVNVTIDNTNGYVAAEYVDVYDTLPKGVTLEDLSEDGSCSSTAADLIAYAEQFLGNPYVWGGTSLTNGTDCSGFTMRIFEHFGYSLSRTSREQACNGTAVSLDEIQPGDLLFYSHGGSIGHVAIYIGNGQIIHASTERTGIIIGNAFYTTPTCARRILN